MPKLIIEISQELHKTLKIMAVNRGVTMKKMITEIVEQEVKYVTG